MRFLAICENDLVFLNFSIFIIYSFVFVRLLTTKMLVIFFLIFIITVEMSVGKVNL